MAHYLSTLLVLHACGIEDNKMLIQCIMCVSVLTMIISSNMDDITGIFLETWTMVLYAECSVNYHFSSSWLDQVSLSQAIALIKLSCSECCVNTTGTLSRDHRILLLPLHIIQAQPCPFLYIVQPLSR